MKFYDVFNGDADGLCALHQLRLAEPRRAELVTGVKRDVGLLARVPAGPGDRVTVLDVSLDANRAALQSVLAAGASVCWFDHHHAGEMPTHPRLEAYIDTQPAVCTSLIVDRHLGGAYTPWAVVAAFGDNLAASAAEAAARAGIDGDALDRLRRLGVAINYNAYGDSVDDLHYAPADLYRLIARYDDPLEFLACEPVAEALESAMLDDLARAEDLGPVLARAHAAAWVLPDAAWSRRVAGVLANRLATATPSRAHAVLVTRGDGYVASVRAPLARPLGADAFCRTFATGGGRAGAAGVQRLPSADLGPFLASFARAFDPR